MSTATIRPALISLSSNSISPNRLPAQQIDQLFAMMRQPGTPTLLLDGYPVTLSAIEREDGSGKSFNVGVRGVGYQKTVYVRQS